MKARDIYVSLLDLPNLQGIDIVQIYFMSKTILEAKKHQDRRDNQNNPKMEVPNLSCTNFEDFDLRFGGVVQIKPACMGFLLTNSSGVKM